MKLILDQNAGKTFQDQEYPVFEIDTTQNVSFEALRNQAKDILSKTKNTKYIVLIPNVENNLLYLFTVALYLEAEKSTNAPLGAVLKISNLYASLEKQRIFTALATGAMYIERSANIEPEAFLKDIETLGYLGLDIKTDYLQDVMNVKLSGEGKVRRFTVLTSENAVLMVSLLKMLSLLQIRPNAEVKLDIKKIKAAHTPIDADHLIARLVKISYSFLISNL